MRCEWNTPSLLFCDMGPIDAGPSVDNHAERGLVARTRCELGVPSTLKEFAVPSARHSFSSSSLWLYKETRVVILIDLRRGSIVWSRRILDVLDCVLQSLSSGPSQELVSESAQPPMIHISVVLTAREEWPLRVLVQGYCHRCGEPFGPLRDAVHEQLRVALSAADPMAQASAGRRGLHDCVRRPPRHEHH